MLIAGDLWDEYGTQSEAESMGRKAKLKQQRKQQAAGTRDRANPPEPTDNPQEFVSRLAQEGYTLAQSMRAPTLPDQDPRPEL